MKKHTGNIRKKTIRPNKAKPELTAAMNRILLNYYDLDVKEGFRNFLKPSFYSIIRTITLIEE